MKGAGMESGRRFVPDESQRKVIAAEGGYHLVLAPPGCGKTQILTERIARAHAQGVGYGDMLCLTFTNRAARGMRERIDADIADDGVRQVYVGNIHRFCSKLLFEQGVVPSETSIIDDADAISIVARYTGDDDAAVMADNRRRNDYAKVVHLCHFVHQALQGVPKAFRLHPECLDSNDIAAMRTICRVQRMPFDLQALGDIYHRTGFYQEALNGDAYNLPLREVMVQTLRKMELAHSYEAYKRENLLVDFEDLLILTYEYLTGHAPDGHPCYRWIQIDEVQDLNPLQIKIVDLVTSGQAPTVMYLGDGQQAIFSFMGARLDTLDALKDRCKGHIHHLGENHRSPKYLLDVFNEYATKNLHIDPVLLPAAVDGTPAGGHELLVRHSATLETEYGDVARAAKWLNGQDGGETTAVIVNSNYDADKVSLALDEERVSHFKVSGVDLFATEEVKLLFAHLGVLVNEHSFISWARILKGLHVFETNGACRNFVQAMGRCAMLPSDLLLYDDGGTYVQDFARCYGQGEMVIFDTETTGLDVFHEDILQIAAVKVRRGEVVPGSELSLFIETERDIPQMLGDMVNPIIEERRHHRLLPHAEGLQAFLDYVGTDVLLGHNADYDYNILDQNLKRWLPTVDFKGEHPKYFDSLKLIRLLRRDLRSYKLKSLLADLHLEGTNSHLADEDVNATRSVTDYCFQAARQVIPLQQAFMQRKRVIDRAAAFRRVYRDLFLHARSLLYVADNEGDNPVLVKELSAVYKQLLGDSVIRPVRGFDAILRFLSQDMIDGRAEPSLVEQVAHHIVEMSTLKEADLCGGSSVTERVFVTTVHKAKGLEFDNVIVFDAVDGRYPNYYTQNDPRRVAEDARKFYVAMTRAKKRLVVWQSDARLNSRKEPQPKLLTPFMRPILRFFEEG